MFKLNVRIAEHLCSFRTESDFIRRELESKFGKVSESPPHRPEPDLTVHLEDGYGMPFAGYGVTAETEENRISFRRADYRIIADPDFGTAKVQVFDGFALKHALLHLYSAFMTHREWGLLMHSSCVADEGRAYLFAGQSGAGKSTVARLSAPRDVLSDEASIVKISAGGITVFNSPFRSDSEFPYLPGSYPLAGIHFLHQAAEDRRARVDDSKGAFQAMSKVFYWSYEPKETLKVLKLSRRLAGRVPFYDLYFRKQNTFWDVIRAERPSAEADEEMKTLTVI